MLIKLVAKRTWTSQNNLEIIKWLLIKFVVCSCCYLLFIVADSKTSILFVVYFLCSTSCYFPSREGEGVIREYNFVEKKRESDQTSSNGPIMVTKTKGKY